MRSWLLSILLCAYTLPALAADTISPSNVVLNAYLSLRAEMAAVRSNEQNLASAVARSQSYFWDYEQISRTALADYWPVVEESDRKWELISAVGRYLNHALSRLMGSSHAVSSLNVEDQALDETGEVAVVIASMRLQSGDRPMQVYFYLRASDQGWKIFNLSAPRAGFHLYQNVRSNVGPALEDGGIEDAIAHLKKLVGT